MRDSQVRTVLLKHFCHYRHGFSVDQLQHHILPELLVGIKDNDDILVASTLRALADLVPVLGAATVIGGKRGKLFTDGRPKVTFSSKIYKKIEINSKMIFLVEANQKVNASCSGCTLHA